MAAQHVARCTASSVNLPAHAWHQQLELAVNTGPNTPDPAHTGDYQLRNQVPAASRGAISPGGYSLAIPVSLITRSYLAS